MSIMTSGLHRVVCTTTAIHRIFVPTLSAGAESHAAAEAANAVTAG